MKLVVDNQLPARLATQLRQLGHDCLHVSDCGLADADDLTLWRYAERENAIVVSKDEDFVFLANAPATTAASCGCGSEIAATTP